MIVQRPNPSNLALEAKHPSESDPRVRELRVRAEIDTFAGCKAKLEALDRALHPQEALDKPDLDMRQRVQAATVRSNSLKSLRYGFTEHRALVQPLHEVRRVLLWDLAQKAY